MNTRPGPEEAYFFKIPSQNFKQDPVQLISSMLNSCRPCSKSLVLCALQARRYRSFSRSYRSTDRLNAKINIKSQISSKNKFKGRVGVCLKAEQLPDVLINRTPDQTAAENAARTPVDAPRGEKFRRRRRRRRRRDISAELFHGEKIRRDGPPPRPSSSRRIQSWKTKTNTRQTFFLRRMKTSAS